MKQRNNHIYNPQEASSQDVTMVVHGALLKVVNVGEGGGGGGSGGGSGSSGRSGGVGGGCGGGYNSGGHGDCGGGFVKPRRQSKAW